jgi:hypothetical protein
VLVRLDLQQQEQAKDQMRIIKLEDLPDQRAPQHTFCVYGATGTGKTTFAGSFPRPVFLSEVTESGYESLRGLSSDALFEGDVPPIVLGIEKMNDMNLAREALAPHIASGMVQTVVIDSLTFYADLYLNHLFGLAGPAANNLKIYGQLGLHLRDLRVKTHNLGCNVVSLCLAQDPNEDQPNGLPMIPGKEAGKFGAGCDFLFYSQHDRFKQGNEWADHFKLHSKPVGKYVARARRAIGMSELPTPLTNTSYAGLIAALGYDVDATRAAMPAYVSPAAAIEAFVMNALQAAPPAPVATAHAAAQVAAQPVKRHVPNAARPATNGRPSPPVVTRRPVPVRPSGSNS